MGYMCEIDYLGTFPCHCEDWGEGEMRKHRMQQVRCTPCPLALLINVVDDTCCSIQLHRGWAARCQRASTSQDFSAAGSPGKGARGKGKTRMLWSKYGSPMQHCTGVTPHQIGAITIVFCNCLRLGHRCQGAIDGLWSSPEGCSSQSLFVPWRLSQLSQCMLERSTDSWPHRNRCFHVRFHLGMVLPV